MCMERGETWNPSMAISFNLGTDDRVEQGLSLDRIPAVMHVWNPKWPQSPRRSVIRCEGFPGMLIVHISSAWCEGLKARTGMWLLNSNLVQASGMTFLPEIVSRDAKRRIYHTNCGHRPKKFRSNRLRPHDLTGGRMSTHYFHTRRSPRAFLMLVWKRTTETKH